MNGRYFSIGYKVLFIILCMWGLSLILGLERGEIRWQVLNYYTIQSNILCLLYMMYALSQDFVSSRSNSQILNRMARVESMVMFCITVTMLIYNFILAPIQFSMGQSDRVFSVSNLLVHYIIPLMMIGDWLLFGRKGSIGRYDPFLWLTPPYLYFIFILIRAQWFGLIPGTSSRYPYPFMNIDTLGWQQVGINATVLTLIFLLLGYTYRGIDRLLSRRAEVRAT